MKIILLIACSVTIIFAIPCLSPVIAGEELTGLKELEAELLENNPEIRAAGELAEAERYRTGAVTGLADPIFTYGYFGESIQTRNGPQEQLFKLSQKLPLGGQLSLRGEMAEKRADSAQALSSAVTWKVLTELRLAYYDLWWVDQALHITSEEEEVLRNLEEIARSKYATGKSSLQDLLKAQLARSGLDERRLLYKQRRSTLTALINRLLDRPVSSSIEPEIVTAAGTLDLSLEELLAAAGESNPHLRAREHMTERARSGLTLARRGYIPDLILGAQYFQIGSGETSSPDDGQDAWLVTAGINIPIWFWNRKAEVNEAGARILSAEENYRRERTVIEFEVKDRYFRFTTTLEQVFLYENSLLPQSRQAFEASRADYETGREDFLNLLESERRLLEIRLAYLEVVINTRKHLAELEEAVGKRIVDGRTVSSER
jgi:outer membrane protein, heavy metal efflux system